MSSKHIECLFGSHTWSNFFAMPTGRSSSWDGHNFIVSRICLICGKDDRNVKINAPSAADAIVFRIKMEEERHKYVK